MIFPVFYNDRAIKTGGMILVDILLALSLAAIFTAVIAQSSASAEDSFRRAKIRKEILEKAAYEETSAIYGNDRIETVQSSPNRDIQVSKVKSRTPDYLDLAGTPLCSVEFRGSPEIEQINLPIDPLLPLTDLEVRNKIAYISADSANSSDPDLLVVDFRDLVRPILRSSLNTGPGLRSIALARNRIYAAAASTFAQLHIILITSLDNISLDNRKRLPLPYATATPPFGSSIFYDKQKIYLGTEKWDGEEFAVFDVGEPSLPKYLFGYETGSKINDILVSNDKAYVAASDQTQLRILDVQGEPVLLDSLSPSGWERQEGKSLSVFENKMAFGRTSGGFNITNDPELFTSSSTSDVPGGVYGIVADRKNLYLISRDVGKELQIFRNGSTSTPVTFSLPVAPQTLTCDGPHLYVLAQTAPVIYEISFK